MNDILDLAARHCCSYGKDGNDFVFDKTQLLAFVADLATHTGAAAAEPTVEQVEDELSMGHGSWDMEDPKEIIRAVLRIAALTSAPAVPEAIRDVLAERQQAVEGWTPQHDDSEHGDSTALAIAAGCYLLFGETYPHPGHAPMPWPWDLGWWKPKGHRRNCVRAAALAIAEIERLDRVALKGVQPGERGEG